MISKPIRTKRRYTLMRQEIIQAARQIILEEGIDTLSMRTIARVVQTSPANLYEYFLNKEEIIFSVYNDILATLLIELQEAQGKLSARADLIAICKRYISFTDQYPSQIQIASYLLQLDLLPQSPCKTAAVAQSEKSVGANNRSPKNNHYYHPTTATYTTHTEAIFQLFRKAVQRCIDEGSISSNKLPAHEITHIIWAFVHGLASLRIQEVSAIDCKSMHLALTQFIDSLATS